VHVVSKRRERDTWAPRHRRIPCAARIARLTALWSIALLVSFSAILSQPVLAGPEVAPATYGYFDFPTCVRYALVHSETLIKNRLEIQIQSADLKDAHSEIFPTFEVQTRYYFARTRNYNDRTESNQKFSASLVMTNFNPMLALIKIKAKAILVDAATTTHQQKISEHIGNMAKLFYRISVLEKTIRAERQIAALLKNKVNYASTRKDQGDYDPIAARALVNNQRAQEIKIRGLENAMDQATRQLKIMMGYPPDFHLPLDTRDAANQILFGFNGSHITFADIQAGNLGLKVIAKREQFQSNMVSGAYLRLLPKPTVIFQDINNQVDASSGTTFGVGLDYTLWDGFRRVRDIKRQKLRASQIKIERSEVAQQLYDKFRALRSDIKLAAEKEGYAREQMNLAEASEERALSQYKSGMLTYDLYMDQGVAKVQARLGALNAVMERVNALIELATISGGLNRYNAGIQY
jgi:outer membrane protein TolC